MTVPATLIDARLLRFGIVTVVGLGIDLALGWTLAARAGLPLWLAATIGFVTAACVNYVLHERWTFAGGRLSAVRGSLFLVLSASALLVRIGALMLLKALVFTTPGQRLVPLILAIGVSFVFNFVVSRQLVFRRDPASGNGSAQ